jgi:hypothetical protein
MPKEHRIIGLSGSFSSSLRNISARGVSIRAPPPCGFFYAPF